MGGTRGGRFISHLIKETCPNKTVTIIDMDPKLDARSMGIKRYTYLNYVDSRNTIILSTVKEYASVLGMTDSYGYIDGINCYDTRSMIGRSYFEYLDNQAFFREAGGDFTSVKKEDNPNLFLNDNLESTPVDILSLEDVLRYIIKEYHICSFFDYGCGKGQAIAVAYLSGIERVGGIEYVESIAKQAEINLNILNNPHDLFCGDASSISDIDEYDCFYLYNPFVGDTFSKTINNIEESISRNNRTVVIIYAHPFEHIRVLFDGVFKLKEQLQVDLWNPLLNIYINC